MSIKKLDELRPVVRALEDTLTFVAVCNALRTKHAVNWVAIKKEAKEKGIATPASIDKHPDRVVVRYLCTPGAWQYGGDRHLNAFRAKVALARQVRAAVVTDRNDDTNEAMLVEKAVAIDDTSNPGIDYKFFRLLLHPFICLFP